MQVHRPGHSWGSQLAPLIAAAREIPHGSNHFNAVRGLILPPGRPHPPLSPQLASHFPAILGLASLPSTDHKVFVLDVIEEAGLRDVKTYPAASTETVKTLLYDESPLVVARAVRALTVLFRKVCGVATLFPQFPITPWHDMERYTTEVLITSPFKSVCYAAIKFAETVLLSFSSSPGRASADHFTLETLALPTTIPVPHVTSSILRDEGLRVASRISGIAQKSFDANAIMITISVLSSVGRRRPSLISETFGPLLTLAGRLERFRDHGMSYGQCRSIAVVLRLHLNAFGKTARGKTRDMKKR